MKDTIETTPAEQAAEHEGFANRKLIRPTLNRHEGREHMERRERPVSAKKSPPPEQTHAENFYYQKQMQARTPMVVVLQDGEEIEGVIEWYDKHCIKVNRTNQANVLIYKPAIKYMFKAGENGKTGR
jgi:RNA chaperone Hfq